MVRDYRNFSYSPDYGYKLTGKNVNFQREQVPNAACFGEVFNLLHNHPTEIYEGHYTLRVKRNFNLYNFCSLKKEEIYKIIRYMRRAFDMKISMTPTKTHFILSMDIVGQPFKHKFILTFCRVFYEFPFNELARDVFRLRKAGKVNNFNYSHIGFLEIYHIICESTNESYAHGHALFYYPDEAVSVKTLTSHFNSGLQRVFDAYPGNMNLWKKFNRINNIIKVDWNKTFPERLEYYSKNFEIIRKYKHEQKKKSLRRRAN